MTDKTAAYKTIAASLQGRAFTLTLNRPPLNILDIAMLKEVRGAVEAAKASGAAFLVLKAEGKAFSAGADVAEHLPDKAQEMLSAFHGTVRALASFEGPVVALVHGAALGGGCELILPADVVLASSEAKLGQPELQLGVFPPAAMALMPSLLPASAARALILTGRTIGAEEALRLGLVHQVFPAPEFEAKAAEFLARFARMSASSLKLAKTVLRRLHPADFDEKLDAAESAYLKELMSTPDAAEGCRAFMEKRKPVWKG